MLHELDLKMLISLIVIGKQIVDAFEEGCECAAVVFFLQQKLLFREHLHQIDQPIASLSTQLLRVRS